MILALIVALLMGIGLYFPPYDNIKEMDYIKDKINNCSVDNYLAPLKYIVRTSSPVQIELMDTRNYLYKTKNMSYRSVKTYHLNQSGIYSISLQKQYYKLNRSCYVLTQNNNDRIIIVKRGYVFRSLWDRICYIFSSDFLF